MADEKVPDEVKADIRRLGHNARTQMKSARRHAEGDVDEPMRVSELDQAKYHYREAQRERQERSKKRSKGKRN